MAVKSAAGGYSGKTVTVYVAFDSTGTITNIKVDASTQTAGIGTKTGDESFYSGFVGWDGTQQVSAGSPVDAIAGATVSSKAVFTAVNQAIDCYNNELEGGGITWPKSKANGACLPPVSSVKTPFCVWFWAAARLWPSPPPSPAHVGMGLAMTFVLVGSNIVISALRKAIPGQGPSALLHCHHRHLRYRGPDGAAGLCAGTV